MQYRTSEADPSEKYLNVTFLWQLFAIYSNDRGEQLETVKSYVSTQKYFTR